MTKETLDKLQALAEDAQTLTAWEDQLDELDGYDVDRESPEHRMIEAVIPEVLLSLIAAARELETLTGAIGYLNDKNVWQNTRPAGIIQTAKDYGWLPSAPEQKP